MYNNGMVNEHKIFVLDFLLILLKVLLVMGFLGFTDKSFNLLNL